MLRAGSFKIKITGHLMDVDPSTDMYGLSGDIRWWRYQVSWALTHPQCKYIPQQRILFESVPDADDSFPRNQQAQNQQEAV